MSYFNLVLFFKLLFGTKTNYIYLFILFSLRLCGINHDYHGGMSGLGLVSLLFVLKVKYSDVNFMQESI